MPLLPVIVVPLLYFPSMTNIPSDKPLIILFLFGKFVLTGGTSGEYSVIIVPPDSKILLYNS